MKILPVVVMLMLPAILVLAFSATLPPDVEPMLILVVDPAVPDVPILTILVTLVAVAPVEILVIDEAVDVLPIVNKDALLAKLTVFAVVASKSKLELVVANEVVTIGLDNVGEVSNTTEPLPVSSPSIEDNAVLVGVVKNVATPVASPVMPVDIGTVTEISAVPSNACPLINRACVSLAAEPVVL